MKQFREPDKKYTIKQTLPLLAMLIMLLFVLSPAYAGNIDDLQEEEEEIRGQLEQEEEELEAMKSEEEQLTQELEELEEELGDIQGKLRELNRDIYLNEAEIRSTERELGRAEDRLEQREDLLQRRLRVIYERGNVGYLEVLFEAKSFSDFLTRIYYLNNIAEEDILLVEEVEAERDFIAGQKEQLEEQKEELDEMRREIASKRNDKRSTIAQRSELREDLQEAMEETRQAMEKLEQEAQSLAGEIERIRREQRQSGEQGERPEGRLLWPVEDPSYITSPFGTRTCPFGSGRQTFHGGLDIGTYGRRNRIFAAEDGTVLMVRSQASYGNFIVIDHGGGLMTLYAHLSSMGVSEGDSVSRGNTIGRAGTTGASTGIHLHFEVWNNDSREDPLNYLE